MALAAGEAAEFDWRDVQFFNSRAGMAAAGQNFEAQNIQDRDIPAEARAGMSTARVGLANALKAGGANKSSQHAARAQAMFDCWMQEQEENFQPPDIARCRAEFDKALKALNTAMMPAPRRVARAAPRPRPRRPAPPALKQIGPFVVFFGFNSTPLTNESREVLADMITAYQIFSPKAVDVTGHTDRAGTSAYNTELAKSRALVVARALATGKVRVEALNIDAMGENKTMVATPDGKREGKNRRVEILIRK